MTQKLEKKLLSIIDQYKESYTDVLMGLSFIRDPFFTDFLKDFGLKADAQITDAFTAFMNIAHQTFRWEDYLEARRTAEEAFRKFYQSQNYDQEKLERASEEFIVSFFNQNIDDRQFDWEKDHPAEEYNFPTETKDDIDNLYFARILAATIDYSDVAADKAFCESIGVRYDYEQLHMCCWFSGQITHGAGNYSRGEANYSARTTYNRLLNPDSLLWIGVVMGADRDELKAAAEEIRAAKNNQTRCGIVRRHIPFDTIRTLYGEKFTE